MNIGERVRFKNYEYKDKKGVIIDIYNSIVVVDVDDKTILFPVATIEKNLEII